MITKLEIEIIETEGDIQITVDEIIPDIQKQLDYLTSPDYDPAGNVDHDLRQDDIEYLSSELLSEQKDLYALQKKLKRLQARMQKHNR